MQEASNLPVEAGTSAPPVAIEAVAPDKVVEPPRSQPKSEEAAATSPTETSQLKEKAIKPTLWQEITSTAKVMISQTVEEIKHQINDAAGDENKINTILSDPKNRTLSNLMLIQTVKQENVIKQGGIIKLDQPVTIVDKDGWINTVVSIVGVDGDSFSVMVIDKDNTTAHQPKDNELVSRQALEQNHLLQKLLPQLSSFPESQGKIIQLYLESVQSGKEPVSLPKNAEKMLLEAAQSAGILTTENIKAMLNRVLPDQDAGEDSTAAEIAKIKEINEKLEKKRVRLLKPFEDHGIIVTEPKQIIDLFNNLGIGSKQLSEQRNQIALESTRLDLLIKANQNNIGKTITLNGKEIKLTKELFRQWQEKKVEANELSLVYLEEIEIFNESGLIKQYCDELNAGTLSQELGQKVVESFQNGKITEPPDVKTAADERSKIILAKMHKIWQRQDILSKTGKGALIGGGGLLGLLTALGFLAMKKKEA